MGGKEAGRREGWREGKEGGMRNEEKGRREDHAEKL